MDKEAKEQVLFGAWIDASMEMSRRILTLSSAGIALLATIGVNLDDASVPMKWMLGSSAVAFVVAVLATLVSLHLDPKVAHEVRVNLGQENSKRQDRLEWWTGSLGNSAALAFGVGLLILLVILLYAIVQLPTS